MKHFQIALEQIVEIFVSHIVIVDTDRSVSDTSFIYSDSVCEISSKMPRKKASRKLETENRLSGKLEELDMIRKKGF